MSKSIIDTPSGEVSVTATDVGTLKIESEDATIHVPIKRVGDFLWAIGRELSKKGASI